MTYREVLERLFAARRAGVVLGLDRVAGVLARLGAPERRLGVVAHVGGTNGKGSTAAMIAAIGAAAGRRVAVYSSPHLSTLRERVVVAGRMIEEAEVVEAARSAWAAGADALTFFEQITVIALHWIAAQRPDITVLEVGLGGRLDATNVVDAHVGVVTGVAMDHEAILGPTLDAIAREKAGIFKPGRRAVIGCSGLPDAVPVLVSGARTAGVERITVVPEGAAAHVGAVGLAGAHQRRNAACALAVIDHLEALRVIDAPSWVRARGLATVSHAGRLERLPGGVILDGAHNPQGAAALAAALGDLPRPRTLILAVSADKDVAAILAPLVPVVDAVVATRYQQPRALAPRELADAARAAGAVRVSDAPDLAAALAAVPGTSGALAAVPGTSGALTAVPGSSGTTIIAGSLMLVGEARTLLLGAPTDPFVVTDPAPGPIAPR